jgi:hypothetical protein
MTIVGMGIVIVQPNPVVHVLMIVETVLQPSSVAMERVILEKIVEHAQAIVANVGQLARRLINMDLWKEVSVS